MKCVTQNYPKVIPIVFYFYYDNFIEPHWVHSMVEILPGFTKETEKRHHSMWSSISGYMCLQILIWHKISPQHSQKDISHKYIFKANSMLDHPEECRETCTSSKGTNSGARSFLPMASCWLIYLALYFVLAQVTQNCAAWMRPLRTSQNIYSTSHKLRFHCNPISKDSFIINFSGTPGQKLKLLKKVNSLNFTLDTTLCEYAPAITFLVFDSLS